MVLERLCVKVEPSGVPHEVLTIIPDAPLDGGAPACPKCNDHGVQRFFWDLFIWGRFISVQLCECQKTGLQA